MWVMAHATKVHGTKVYHTKEKSMLSNQLQVALNLETKGRVSMTLKHPAPKQDEKLLFECIEDMEACATVRPYIPKEVWEVLIEMYKAAQAQHNPKFI